MEMTTTSHRLPNGRELRQERHDHWVAQVGNDNYWVSGLTPRGALENAGFPALSQPAPQIPPTDRHVDRHENHGMIVRRWIESGQVACIVIHDTTGYWAKSRGRTQLEAYRNAMAKFRAEWLGNLVGGLPANEQNTGSATIDDIIAART